MIYAYFHFFVMQKQKQYKVQKHLLLKNRNDYLLGITRCNALSSQYFSRDIMDIVEVSGCYDIVSVWLELAVYNMCSTWTLTIMTPSDASYWLTRTMNGKLAKL